MKDVTSTSFGLIIAYLLPGLAGFFTMSFWFPSIGNLFEKFGASESSVGLFLLVILIAVTISLQINILRYWIFEKALCRDKKFEPKDLENLADKDKHIAFRTIIDEQYRYHQFWGGMSVVQVPLFYGWISAHFEGYGVIIPAIPALVLEALTILAAKEAFNRYIDRATTVLRRDPDAKRIPQEEKGSRQESSQESSSQENQKAGSEENAEEEEA